MRVLLVGGGTVGHVTPALAIAEEIKNRDKNSAFLFVGRESGEENKEIKKAKIPLELIKIKGIKRSLSLENLKTAIMIPRAIKKAKEILASFKPDVVIGTGGYVCYPVLTAARRMKIPTVIHESNSSPGITAKLLSKKCDLVFLGFEDTVKNLKRKDNVTVSGTPVRKEFTEASKEASRQKLGIPKNDVFILSFGGSGGAEVLNRVIIDTMAEYSGKKKRIIHVHATGRKYFSREKEKLYSLLPKRCIIRAYIENMPLMLSGADIVISRSGAMSISEIAATGKAAILIPSPNVTGNHQYKNAKALLDRGAAILIEEDNLTSETLIKKLQILENPEERRRLEKNISAIYRSDSASVIADGIFRLLQGRK